MQAYCGCDTTLLGKALRLPSELVGDRGSSGMSTSSGGRWLGAMGYASKCMSWGDGMWQGSGINCWLGQSDGMTIVGSPGSDMGLLESLEVLSIFWSTRCSMDEYWRVCWLQGIGGVGYQGLMAGTGRWTAWYGRGSGMGMTGGRTGALGGKDSFGSAEGNMMVEDGSRLVQGVTKGGEAAEDDCYKRWSLKVRLARNSDGRTSCYKGLPQ